MRSQSAAAARARSGALTEAAAAAARGRAHPPERRVKTLATLAGNRQARAEGSRRHARAHLERVAAAVAARFGFTDFSGYLHERLGRGMSLAAISREAGMHKDWVSRRFGNLTPRRPHPGDVRLAPAASGFADVGAYLRRRHVEERRSVAAIAAEAGVSRETVNGALRRHGIEPVPHATKRHQAARRDETVARSLGFDSLAAYVAQRRARNIPWKRLAAESGVPETTLRRHGERQRRNASGGRLWPNG